MRRAKLFFLHSIEFACAQTYYISFFSHGKSEERKRGRRHTGYIEYDKQLGVLAIHEVKKTQKLEPAKNYAIRYKQLVSSTGKHANQC